MRLFLVAALVALGFAALPAEVAASPDQPARAAKASRAAARRADATLASGRRRSSGGAERGRPSGPSASVRREALRAQPAPPVRADSVGFPNGGRLEGGVRLDTTRPWIRVVPQYAAPDLRWGLPFLVDMIDRAAKGVAKRYPGSALDVGDISQRKGGDLLRHHSHESGRDADLGFYVLDAKGKQVHAHTFIKFDASLRSETVPAAHFDAARNWLLVQQMLLDPKAHVSHVFIAEPLKQQLLAYARKAGVSQAILDRAAMTLMQPTNSLPHDDHMHVRISCPHAAASSCVELAKNAPRGGHAIAHRQRPGWHAHSVVLKTPPRPDAAVAKPPPSLFKAGEVKEPPMRLVPEGEADADAAEVKDALDEVGGVLITD